MLLTIALAAGAATLTWALLRLRRLQPAAVYQAETVVRLSGHAITALARVVVLAADVLHVLSQNPDGRPRAASLHQAENENENEGDWGSVDY